MGNRLIQCGGCDVHGCNGSSESNEIYNADEVRARITTRFSLLLRRWKHYRWRQHLSSGIAVFGLLTADCDGLRPHPML